MVKQKTAPTLAALIFIGVLCILAITFTVVNPAESTTEEPYLTVVRPKVTKFEVPDTHDVYTYCVGENERIYQTSDSQSRVPFVVVQDARCKPWGSS